MKHADALALLRPALPPAPAGGAWADLGAGTGTFTRALAEILGPAGRVLAADADGAALAALRAWAAARTEPAAEIDTLHADFTRALELPPLDGVLMANALHFVRDAEGFLPRAVSLLNPGGRLVVVEYEGRRASPWVPHPVPPARLRELAAGAGLTPPGIVARRPSAFGGEMYVAVLARLP